MDRVSLLAALHVLGAVVAAASAVGSTLTRERRRADVATLRWAAYGTVVWALCVASVKQEGIHDWHQMAWFPAIAFTSGALLLWAGRFASYDWEPPRTLLAMVVGVPALMLFVRITWGLGSRDPLFVFNTVYCFGLLVVMTTWLSRRANDPAPAVRLVARGLVATAVGVLFAEAFRANVTDLVAAVALAVLTTITLTRGHELRSRPRPDTLIDDLGALLFVFDRDQQLVDLNAPARQFYSLRGAEPPSAGLPGAALLGADLGTLDAVFVELAVGTTTVPMSGYVQRLPSHGSPSSGWVCLLRRSSRPPTADEARRARRDLMNRLPARGATAESDSAG